MTALTTPAPGALSLPTGGEMRRCSIASALLCRPPRCATDPSTGRRAGNIGKNIEEHREVPGTRSCLCYYRSYPRVCSILCMGYTLLLSASARLQFDEQLVNIKRRVAVKICLGRYPMVARRCLASYTPQLAELQVEGGNVGPKFGTWVQNLVRQPLRHLGCSHPSGAAAQLRCGAGFSEPVRRWHRC